MSRSWRAVVLGVLTVGGILLAPGAAWAAPTTQVVQGDVIRLVSVADWEAASRLLPGEPVQWDVAVSADAPDPGTVSVAVSATGEAPLTLDVSVCMSAWQPSGCAGGATVVRSGWNVPRDGGEIAITRFPDSEVAHIRLAITLGPDDDGGSTDIRVHAQAVGESVTVGPDGDGLATTGLAPGAPWMFGVGGLLLAIGAVLASRRRARRDAAQEAR